MKLFSRRKTDEEELLSIIVDFLDGATTAEIEYQIKENPTLLRLFKEMVEIRGVESELELHGIQPNLQIIR